MSRAAAPIVWPEVRRPAAAPAPAPVAAPQGPEWLEPRALAPLMALAIGGHMGRRIGLRPVDGSAEGSGLLLGHAEAGPLRLALSASPAFAAWAMDRLFGTGGTADPQSLDRLAPASASWGALAALAGEALATAVAALAGPRLALAPTGRPAPAPVGREAWASFAVDQKGGPVLLLHLGWHDVRDSDAPLLPAVPDDWQARVRSMALAVDLPVRLRVAQWRLPVARLAAMRPGDMIAIRQPTSLGVIVDGTAIAEVPTGSIAAKPSTTQQMGNRS